MHQFEPNSPLKKASLTGFHATAKHIAAKAVSPPSARSSFLPSSKWNVIIDVLVGRHVAIRNSNRLVFFTVMAIFIE